MIKQVPSLNMGGKISRNKKRVQAAHHISTCEATRHYEDLPEAWTGLTDGARSSTVYVQRGSAENVGVECAAADGTLPENSYSPASPVEGTETLCKTLADETRERDETPGKKESKPHRMLPDAIDTVLDAAIEAKDKGPEDDGDGVEQYDGGTGEYINLPPTIQHHDQFDAGGPQRACNGRPANLGYTPAKMYIDSSTAAVRDFRSDDDSRLANGIIMIIVLPRSSVSVAVGVRVLIGLDSEKLEARQKEAEHDGYRKADVFECNIYKNGGDVQVKLQNIEWMSREATEKNVFNNSIDELWSGIVSSSVFHIKSYDAVKPGSSVDSNFCGKVVVEQAGRDHQALTVGFMQDLHCCVSTSGNRCVLPHCRCRECVVETNKQPPQADSPAKTARHAADAVAQTTHHRRQRAKQQQTTESSSDMSVDNYNFQSENEVKCRQDVCPMNISDDGPKCEAWSYQ